ncbi:hypothetical protein AX14_001436 [Amanita brunnescens Koide BX004]|nr:hypothetical protein AX14_001436 [Amanita brunnescens Koide BX004]
MTPPQHFVEFIRPSPDFKKIAFSWTEYNGNRFQGGKVHIHELDEDVDKFEQLTTLDHSELGFDARWVHDKHLMTLTHGGSVYLWKVNKIECNCSVLVDIGCRPFCFDYAGQYLVVGCEDGMVRRWKEKPPVARMSVARASPPETAPFSDLRTRQLGGVQPETVPRAIAIRNFGQRLAISGGKGRFLSYFSLELEKPGVETIELGDAELICAIKTSSDQGYLLVSGITVKGGCAYLVDLHSMCLLSCFHSDTFHYRIDAIFLPSDRWVALVDGKKVRILLLLVAATVNSMGEAVLLTVPGKELSTLDHITWIPDQHRSPYHLQLLPCLSPQYKGIHQCAECQEGYDGPVTCPWLGTRLLLVERHKYKYGFLNNNFSHLLFKDLKDVSPQSLIESKSFIAATILLFLEKQLNHVSNDEVVIRGIDARYKRTCDGCSRISLWSLWFCQYCARDICSTCKGSKDLWLQRCQKGKSGGHSFLKTSHLSLEDIHEAMAQINGFLQTHGPPQERNKTAHKKGGVRVLDAGALEGDIEGLLKEGRPFVQKLGPQEDFGPQYFIETFGKQPCKVSTGEEEQTTDVGTFFLSMERSETGRKLKDWPPDGDMSSEVKKIYYDSIPLPRHTAPNGSGNLYASYPKNGPTPDIGPKLYAALGETHTNLHMDATDAINRAYHCGSDKAAHWLFIHPDSIQMLNQYLYKLDDSEEYGVPLLSGSHFLEQEQIASLRNKGMRFLEYKQDAGDAIFIPAGWPHQVYNENKSVKIATDFISPYRLTPLIQLTDAISSANRNTKAQECDADELVREDLIGIEYLLWYAWKRFENS